MKKEKRFFFEAFCAARFRLRGFAAQSSGRENQKTFFKWVARRHPVSTRNDPKPSLRGGVAGEAIHLSLSVGGKDGLLRFARNDGEGRRVGARK
jgi:hypothetical protein